MIKVGLTGGIGAGKSMVCNIFSKLGIPVYVADTEAKLLMNTNPAIRQQLLALFGKNIYLENDVLDRKKLSEIIFNDKIALAKVNAIVHPIVRKHFDKWADLQKSAYVIQEAAILFESGQNIHFDKIILLTAPYEVKIERVMKRDNVSREKVIERMNNQLTDEEKILKSDFIINNDNISMVLPQVLDINKKLQ
ncbi:MAG TPA: dephospho-CoA kinase [Prolixibacteraceae bacterium]|nr:dephospho-CoA kinase [Prolixibacteraceae bacterium]